MNRIVPTLKLLVATCSLVLIASFASGSASANDGCQWFINEESCATANDCTDGCEAFCTDRGGVAGTHKCQGSPKVCECCCGALEGDG